MVHDTDEPFWKTTPLEKMSQEQWESLCDGCGRCCLHKLEDEETEKLFYTDVACRLLDRETCRCSNYSQRTDLVADCLVLSSQTIYILPWMPATCAYRRIYEGRPLAWWHPLVSGDPGTVHLSGISVRGRTVPEEAVHPDEIEFRIIDWLDDEEPHQSDT